ncbi:ABC transporter substrate-binding protein [Luedemannella flava]
MQATVIRRVTGRQRIVRALALLAVPAVLAAGCGDGGDSTTANPTGQVRYYGTDGNMSNTFGDLFKDAPGAINGMTGTTPLTPLGVDFVAKLREVDPKLRDYNYAGESYDAVVISALAAEVAGTTEPAAVAAQINAVTSGGSRCESPAQCLNLIHQGRDIAYRGVSQLAGFTDAGEPAAGSYGTLYFGKNNTIEDGRTEYVPAGDVAGASTKAAPKPGDRKPGQLVIGGLLPQTGSLALMGPPMFAGAELGILDVNAAGGILDSPVKWIPGDDGTSEAVAKKTTQRLIDEGAHVIIGAGASGISTAVLPLAVQAGVILFSPCNTAASLTTAADNGLYFRTAPADGLQAKALTDILMRDGARRVFIVARDDAYGQGLDEGVTSSLHLAGVADVKSFRYNVDKPSFSGLGAQVKEFRADAVLLVGFEESADAIKDIAAAGITVRG